MGDAGEARHLDANGRLRPRRQARRGGDDHTRHLSITLYSGRGCHLCDRARETLLAELGAEGFEEIEIDGDPELEERYREWLPVVEIGGQRAFVYFVDPTALRRRLAQSPRS